MRYFFILIYADKVIDDPRGTVLPSDEAAIEAARPIIDDLLEDCGPGITLELFVLNERECGPSGCREKIWPVKISEAFRSWLEAAI